MHELRRRLEPQRRVQPFPVVKHLDVFERRRLHVLACSEAPSMHPLVLEAVEPALGRGVVPAVTLAAHRAGHAVFGQLVLKRMAGVLAAPVRVMQHPRAGLASEPRHGQRIGHDVRRHARLERPAHHFAIEQIKDNGQIQPAFVRPQVGDVGGPDLVRRFGCEVPLQQVVRHRQAVLRVGRDLEFALVPRPDAVLLHQPLDAFLARGESSGAQFQHHAGTAIRALEFGMDDADYPSIWASVRRLRSGLPPRFQAR